jgi:CBS domain-containing protein
MTVVPPSTPTVVGEVMATRPITVAVDAGLAEAAGLLERHQVSGLPVLDADGRLAGVISDTDLLRARTTDYLWARWQSLRVRQLMTTPALTIGRGESLAAAARRMERHRVGRLVVVADEDPARVVGIVAISDLLRVMAALPEDAVPEPLPALEPVALPDLGPDAPEERGD